MPLSSCKSEKEKQSPGFRNRRTSGYLGGLSSNYFKAHHKNNEKDVVEQPVSHSTSQIERLNN